MEKPKERFIVEIEVDVDILKDECRDTKDEDIEDLILQEFGWVAGSGISVIGLKPKDEKTD